MSELTIDEKREWIASKDAFAQGELGDAPTLLAEIYLNGYKGLNDTPDDQIQHLWDDCGYADDYAKEPDVLMWA